MADVFSQSDALQNLDDTMTEMIAASNACEVIQVTHSRCPVHIVTRWFSRENSLSWLLKHEEVLCNLDISRINRADREIIARLMKEETFAKLRMLRAIIIPFTKCVRFFERDDV
jgi:hypothetical protein